MWPRFYAHGEEGMARVRVDVSPDMEYVVMLNAARGIPDGMHNDLLRIFSINCDRCFCNPQKVRNSLPERNVLFGLEFAKSCRDGAVAKIRSGGKYYRFFPE